MLGVQESRTNGCLAARMYRCMACSASFSSLSALLVHQTSHANNSSSIPETCDPLDPPPQISCSSCKTTFACKELLEQHHCSAGPAPVSDAASSSVSIFICDCGHEFRNFNIMLEHKRTHSLHMRMKPLILAEENMAKTVNSPGNSGALCMSDSKCLDAVSSSAPAPSVPQLPKLANELPTPELVGQNDLPLPTSPVFHNNGIKKPLVVGQVRQIPVSKTSSPLVAGPLQHTTAVNMTSVPGISDTVFSSGVLQNEPEEAKSPKKTLKKMLVSAFMKRLPAAQVAWRPSETHTSPKPVAAACLSTPKPFRGSSVTQLRRLLSKHGQKSMAKRIIPTERHENIRNLIRVFLPIVMLETRQKLPGVFNDAEKGRHQCGYCRKVFHSINNLILHHALHKKVEIKGCRCCKRLVINQTSIPFQHVCPDKVLWALENPFSVGTVVASCSGTLTARNQKSDVESSETGLHHKLFCCQHCKHSYTRLYSLKKHRCQRRVAGSGQQSNVHVDGHIVEGGTGKTVDELGKLSNKEGPSVCISVAVGTDKRGFVKLENLESESSPVSEAGKSPDAELGLWQKSSKKFMPFIPKVVKHEDGQKQKESSQALGAACSSDSVTNVAGVAKDEVEKDGHSSVCAKEKMAWWTAPINEPQKDGLSEIVTGNEESLIPREPSLAEAISSVRAQQNPAGQRRFVCSQCGKNYTRRFTLRQHQKVCLQSVKTPGQHHVHTPPSLKEKAECENKERFGCERCGKTFSRKDNLGKHQKKCPPLNAGTDVSAHSGIDKNKNTLAGNSQGLISSKEKKVTLSQPLGVQDNSTGMKREESDRSWDITSLPPVLPRKVTCECGSVFTCPRLLFEHLQMHTEESYICLECGKNLQSWRSFEAHLRTHQRLVCPQCQQTFSQRSSLTRHLSKNRCRGRAAHGARFTCSRCDLQLSSYASFRLHLQTSACKPSVKSIGCPVCTRTFSSVGGLQNHLISHSHQGPFRCHICHRNYSSLKSLKEHRKTVHHKMFSINKEGGMC